MWVHRCISHLVHVCSTPCSTRVCVHFDLNWNHVAAYLSQTKGPVLIGKRHTCSLLLENHTQHFLIRPDLGCRGKEFTLPPNPNLFLIPDIAEVRCICERFPLCSAHFFVHSGDKNALNPSKDQSVTAGSAARVTAVKSRGIESSQRWKGRMAKYLQAAGHFPAIQQWPAGSAN